MTFSFHFNSFYCGLCFQENFASYNIRLQPTFRNCFISTYIHDTTLCLWIICKDNILRPWDWVNDCFERFSEFGTPSKVLVYQLHPNHSRTISVERVKHSSFFNVLQSSQSWNLSSNLETFTLTKKLVIVCCWPYGESSDSQIRQAVAALTMSFHQYVPTNCSTEMKLATQTSNHLSAPCLENRTGANF